jgi:hypothetical protein
VVAIRNPRHASLPVGGRRAGAQGGGFATASRPESFKTRMMIMFDGFGALVLGTGSVKPACRLQRCFAGLPSRSPYALRDLGSAFDHPAPVDPARPWRAGGRSRETTGPMAPTPIENRLFPLDRHGLRAGGKGVSILPDGQRLHLFLFANNRCPAPKCVTAANACTYGVMIILKRSSGTAPQHWRARSGSAWLYGFGACHFRGGGK